MRITPRRIKRWAQEAIRAANKPEHEHDRKAISWPHLTPDSIVFEVGSFKGRWAYQICERYAPQVFCFEPQPWAADTTRKVLEKFENAEVFTYGLGSRNGLYRMCEWGTDGAKVHMAGEHEVEVRDVAQTLVQLGIKPHEIDLMLVNIEGGEYDLLPAMFAKNILPAVLMVQFHFEPYEALREIIEGYYDILWDYGRTLAAFGLKEEFSRGDDV